MKKLSYFICITTIISMHAMQQIDSIYFQKKQGILPTYKQIDGNITQEVSRSYDKETGQYEYLATRVESEQFQDSGADVEIISHLLAFQAEELFNQLEKQHGNRPRAWWSTKS